MSIGSQIPQLSKMQIISLRQRGGHNCGWTPHFLLQFEIKNCSMKKNKGRVEGVQGKKHSNRSKPDLCCLRQESNIWHTNKKSQAHTELSTPLHSQSKKISIYFTSTQSASTRPFTRAPGQELERELDSLRYIRYRNK